ncbi:MAG: hypothetical protein K2X82_00725 [Gemmataceae bacterium]|nr:hypothetical protein [Gemmataceae bacterium]
MPARTHLPRTRLGIEALEDRTQPSTGGLLDPTFGTGGVANTAVVTTGPRMSTTGGVSLTQPDGKTVVAGAHYSQTSFNVGYVDVARYNANGTLDTTFDGDGMVSTKYGYRLGVSGVALDPTTNKLLVLRRGGGNTTLSRYNANGGLDKTFGGGKGEVSVAFPGTLGFFPTGMTVQSVGGVTKLLAYGMVDTAYTNGRYNTVFGLTRINWDGTPDTSFGTGGRVTNDLTPTLTGTDRISSAVVQPDGKIVVVGKSDYNSYAVSQAVVARYTAAGALDPTFGSGGVSALLVGPTTDGNAVALQPDGKIVVGGSAQVDYLDALVARFNPNGSLDGTFRGGGYFTTDLVDPGHNDYIAGLAIQADGRIVAGAVTEDVANGSVLLRYNADGSADATFGGAGRVVSPVGINVRLQGDGKVVVSGASNGRLAAARFLMSAPQVGSFAAAQVGGSVALTAGGITGTNPGATVVQVKFYRDSNGDGKLDASDTLLGTGTQNPDGTWTLAVALAPGSYTLFAVATDSLGAVGDPASLGLPVV